jgi:hypothetical protein
VRKKLDWRSFHTTGEWGHAYLLNSFFRKATGRSEELGFVPLSRTGAELLFEVFSLCYERGATLVTSNLPFQGGPR